MKLIRQTMRRARSVGKNNHEQKYSVILFYFILFFSKEHQYFASKYHVFGVQKINNRNLRQKKTKKKNKERKTPAMNGYAQEVIGVQA